MSTFAETLKKCLDEAGFSQKMAANLCGCSRTMINSVLSQKKQLSETSFQTLIHEAPFTEDQKRRLRVEFYTEKYSAGTAAKIDIINMRFQYACASSPNQYRYSAIPPSSGDIVMLTMPELIAQSCALIREQAEKYDAPVIITNFPFSEKDFDNAVYETLAALNKHIDFKHIIELDKTGKSDSSISMIFDSIRYIRQKYVPLIACSMLREDCASDALYRYYFTGNGFLILFNTDMSGGILIRSPEPAAAALQRAQSNAVKCEPIATLPESYLSLKELLEQSGKLTLQSVIDNYIRVGKFVDEEMLNAVLRTDLPGREQLIKNILHNYEPAKQLSCVDFFLTAHGFRNFAATGMVQELPADWTVPMPTEYRKIILQRYIDLLAAEEQRVIIINDNLLRFSRDDRFSLELFASKMSMLGSISDKSKSFLGEYVSFFRDEPTVAPFKAYLDFIKRNKLYYNRDYSIHFLNDLIFECDTQSACE